MSHSFVVFDLEATGLSPERNEIIEIGAVRIEDGTMVDTFDTLLRPTGEVPEFIQHMTGIAEGMLQAQPTLAEVWPRFAQFAADAIWVAHNASYDMGMLRGALKRQNVNLPNLPVVDTQDLILLFHPNIDSLRLDDVCRHLGVPLGDAHRAAADARAAAQIFCMLLGQLETMPRLQLQQINRMLRGHAWPLKEYLADLETRRARGKLAELSAESHDWAELVSVSRRGPSPQAVAADGRSLAEETRAAFAEGGTLEKLLPQYECRPAQARMAQHVAWAIEQDAHALLEAGTGTGKSLAYLIPAALHSVRSGEQVVVATFTKNLQDQLWTKDVPLLKKIFGAQLQVSIIKGRENYVCLRKWEETYQETLLGRANPLVTGAWLRWLSQTERGDLSELHGSIGGSLISRVKSETSTCIAERCRHFHRCFAFKARREARQAQVVLGNHALVLRDLAGDHFLLKPYPRLIIDEAQHLEATAAEVFGFRVLRRGMLQALRQILSEKNDRHSGLLQLKRILDKQGEHADLPREQLSDLIRSWPLAYAVTQDFFDSLRPLLSPDESGARLARSDRLVTIAVTPQLRQLETWQAWLAAAARWRTQMVELLKRAHELIDQVSQIGEPELEGVLGDLRGPIETLRLMLAQVADFAAETPDLVRWLEFDPGRRSEHWAVVAAPLQVSALLERQLFAQKRSVILSSATLTVNGSFDYLKQRLGLEAQPADRCFCERLSSDFNYREQALLCLATDLSWSHQDRQVGRQLAQWLLPIFMASQGRALVLFTSYALLEQVALHLREPARVNGLTVLSQNQMLSSRRVVFERFKSGDGPTVLLATNSFWEGVDIPGEALSLVVVVKLPFDVPSDPLVAARTQALDAEGKSGFLNYQIPRAVLRFKQGIGRLIRSRTDRGVVLVLDERIRTKPYGKSFLRAAADYQKFSGTQTEIMAQVREWLTPSRVAAIK